MANQFIVNLSTEGGLPMKEAALAGWDASAATWDANGTTAILDVTTVTGSGSGAKAEVEVAGGPGSPTYAVTITEGGDGYKVGDEIAILGDGNEFSDELTFTITSGALVTPDSETQALVPVGKLSLNGGTSDNAEAILLSVNNTMKEAMQAPHRNPVLVLPDGVTCYDVALS